MNNDLQNHTKDFLKTISDIIHYFIKDHVSSDWVLICQIIAKLLLLAAIVVLLDLLFRIILKGASFFLGRKIIKNLFLKALYKSKALDSVANFLALGISMEFIYSIFYRHKESYVFLERTFHVLMIISSWILYKRILVSIEKFYELKQDSYRTTVIRAITQSLNIIGVFFFIFLGITNIFGVSSTAIFGSLTAMMAVLMLVFKDTILGFVTGIHVSTSKNLKVGDWIGIPKYNIDGNILDISLLTTKILNFDKTVSTIPTYDLMSTEIRNNQVMAEGRVRRIKRSIIFNIYSFKFADAEFLDRLMKINLISEYLETRRREISDLRAKISNPELLINGRQLTNIGIFRKYVQNYLSKNPNIEKKEGILVRQLEVSPQGMPLEIYCFAKRENAADFENIVSDIFDHLLSSFKMFDLEIVQGNKV